MATVRLMALAVCFMVATNLDSASARPQFFFAGGVGAQTPIGGFALGVPTGFPFNFGQPQQQQPQQQQPQQQQQQPYLQQQQQPQLQQQYQQPQQPQHPPQQQYPQQQQHPPQQQHPQHNSFMGATSQQHPNVEHPKAPASSSEGLGTRISGDPEPSEVDENPCQYVDTSTGETNSTDDGGNATEQPCLGIGGGNRINPKQAALLSLVG
ncbi:signal transducer and activator of transcription C-like [Anopheles moucheti]|uniref:signal transducer and activator of transcription C-like n=1 Tax=Anopheles moucheti TaxID=186751 RepID=UPI0022F0E983|nr:signal transducer and activator of transcription C-like [Anopheles moucheti]